MTNKGPGKPAIGKNLKLTHIEDCISIIESLALTPIDAGPLMSSPGFNHQEGRKEGICRSILTLMPDNVSCHVCGANEQLDMHEFKLFKEHISSVHYFVSSIYFYNDENNSKHGFSLEYTSHIWALFLTGSIILLQLVKIKILDPSGGVLSSKVEFCLRRSIKFRFGGVQI